MPIRNTHRVGDYLAVDDESGLTFLASEMARDWDGQWRHKDNLDGRHPQLDVQKAVRRDPQALTDVRPRTAHGIGGDHILLEDGLNVFVLLTESSAKFILEDQVLRRG
jgi:hypothetical protein